MKNILIILLILTTSNSYAGALPDECLVDEERAKPFVATYHEVKKIVDLFCQGSVKEFTTSEIDDLVKPALQKARDESSELLNQYSWYVLPWMDKIWVKDPNTGKLSYPERAYEYIYASHKALFKNGSLTVRELPHNNADATIEKCDSEVKECDKKFSALAYLFNRMLLPLKLEKLEVVRQHVIDVDNNWDRFVKESRSQTFFDIYATTHFYEIKQDSEDKLNPPPTFQLFFLHPSIIIENVSAAIDGEQIQEGVAIELFGINWWDAKTSPLPIPVGISVVASYSDVPGVENTAIGCMFYLDNKYSFGITSHNGDAGVFITLDLLKFLGDKKSQLNSWKKYL